MRWVEVERGVWISHRDRLPVNAVVGGMHGDEVMGVRAIETLLETDPATLDACCLLIIGNPEALAVGTRGTTEGVDLNRSFAENGDISGKYERERSALLKKLLHPVTRLLDLHQTHCKTPPLAVVKYDTPHLVETARLGLSYAVVGVEKIYSGAMLSDWVDRKGGMGITVETGMADTPEAYEVGVDLGRRFLHLTTCSPSDAVEVFDVDHIIRAPFSDGVWKKDVGNGTLVVAGEDLVEVDGRVVKSPGDGVLLLPHIGVKQGKPLAVFARVRASFHPGEQCARD